MTSQVAAGILAAILSLFLLLAGFFSVYYDHGPKSVWNTQGWNTMQQERVQATYEYLNHHAGDPSLTLYAENERAHLADVRQLLDWAKGLFVAFTLILIGSGIFAWRRREQEIRTTGRRTEHGGGAKELWSASTRVLLWGGVGGFCIVLLLALLSLVDFSWFWSGPFHRLLFPQGNWLFPADSALITLFPENFFRRFSTHVLLALASYSLLALLAAWSLRTASHS